MFNQALRGMVGDESGQPRRVDDSVPVRSLRSCIEMLRLAWRSVGVGILDRSSVAAAPAEVFHTAELVVLHSVPFLGALLLRVRFVRVRTSLDRGRLRPAAIFLAAG